MELLSNIKLKINKISLLLKKFNIQNARFRHCLIDVIWNDKEKKIKLAVIINGIKKHIVTYFPEEILYDDELLSEFSPCDVRAITYLSFRRFINYKENSLVIFGQFFKNGETTFKLNNLITSEIINISAKKLYQNHDYLSCLGYADMINAISTAVQEQTFKDFEQIKTL